MFTDKKFDGLVVNHWFRQASSLSKVFAIYGICRFRVAFK